MQISAQSYVPPLGEVLEPESHPISLYHRELQSAARSLRQSLVRISYYGWRMRLCDGWVTMGLASGPKGEEAYREMIDVPRSTWYKHVRIGQALHQLSLEDLERIPTTNRELLIQVDATLVHDYPWVREAQTEKPAKFAEKIAERNKTVGGQDPLAPLVFKVPFLAKQAIEDMIEEFQHRHELPSKGRALELMVADRHLDANLLSTVHQARQLLFGVVQSMRGRHVLDTNETMWVTMAKELLDEGYEKAVQAAREKPNGNQKGGRP